MSSDAKSEMSASEMAMRKFLKQLGVTGHQKLSDALEEAVRSGAVAPGAEVPVTATIDMDALQFTHVVTAARQAPDASGRAAPGGVAAACGAALTTALGWT